VKRLVTTQEFAELISVSKRQVQKWIHDGVIQADINLGRVIRLDPDKACAALAKRAKRNRHSVAAPSDLVPLI
jgi:excisionase family DNA binding protein